MLQLVSLAIPLLILALARRLGYSRLLSPVFLVTLIGTIVGFFGYLLFNQLNGMAGAGIILDLPQELRSPTAQIYATSLSSFAFGAVLFGILRGTWRLPSVNLDIKPRNISNSLNMLIIFISAIPAMLLTSTLGAVLVQRDVYLPHAASDAPTWVISLGLQLSFAAICALGFVSMTPLLSHKVLLSIVLLWYAVIFFSYASRRLSLIPLLFLVGYLISGGRKIARKAIVAAIVTVVLFPIPLYVRSGASSHGLIPYFQRMMNFELSSIDWLELLNNILISFQITAATAFETPRLPLQHLTVVLNPLPGQIAGWPRITDQFFLNRFTPFSAFGELWNYGTLVAVIVWGIFGFITGALDRAARIMSAKGNPVASIAITGLCIMFILQALQYPLRNSSRLLLYATVLAILFAAMPNKLAQQTQTNE